MQIMPENLKYHRRINRRASAYTLYYDKFQGGIVMCIYCKDKKRETDSVNIDEWFTAGEDVDDFIFYNENEKVSDK